MNCLGHSHEKGQYPDGLRGPMIIDDPEDPYADEYDEEYVLTISDWYVTSYPVDNIMSSSSLLGSTMSLSRLGKPSSIRITP